MTTTAELKELANADPTTSPYRVSVLYGDYGKRKTSTACKMVDNKGLLLSSDDSWKVLLNARHAEVYEKITVRELDYISRLDYIDTSGYDTIIWDTVSQSVDTFLDVLYDEASWSSKSGTSAYREQLLSKDPKNKNPELQGLEALAPIDYRVTRDKLRPYFNRLFRETNAHIIFTSQMVEPLPGLSKDQRFRPSIPAATFKTIATRADIIANITGDNNKFFANMSEGSITSLGKSRIEGLQGKMDLDAFVTKYKEIVFS